MSEGGTELGRFLRARRALVRPEEVGLPAGVGVRRTPGLRREELATLAGVSVDYYVRLERGRENNPSPGVLDAIARALRLTGDAHERLHELAEFASGRAPATAGGDSGGTTVRESVLRMLEALRPLPAYVVGRTNDVLAANPAGRALLPGLWEMPPEQRNITRYMFLHPVGLSLFEPRDEIIPESVAHLRAVGGLYSDSPELAALVGELLLKSEEFADLWGRYEVRQRGNGVKGFNHPTAGHLFLSYEAVSLTHSGGQRLVSYQAEPGSADEKAVLTLDPASVG